MGDTIIMTFELTVLALTSVLHVPPQKQHKCNDANNCDDADHSDEYDVNGLLVLIGFLGRLDDRASYQQPSQIHYYIIFICT